MKCSVDDCDAPARARGWCSKHYARWRKHGDPNMARRYRSGEECSHDGCGLPGNGGQGLCKKHYRRWWKTGDVHRARDGKGRQPGPPCDFPGCRGLHFTHGWCQRHWKLVERYGYVLATGRTKNHPASPDIWADLNMARTMRAHGRRRDVEFYLCRAGSHGRHLSKVEEAFVNGLRMTPDRERDTSQLRDDVMRLTAEGLGAKEIGRRLGVSDRTVVRYRTGTRGLENINA